MSKAKEPTPEQTIGDLRAEVKEEHDWRMRLHDEIRNLQAVNAEANDRLTTAAQILLNERETLLCRVNDIEAIVRLMGFEVAGDDEQNS